MCIYIYAIFKADIASSMVFHCHIPPSPKANLNTPYKDIICAMRVSFIHLNFEPDSNVNPKRINFQHIDPLFIFSPSKTQSS